MAGVLSFSAVALLIGCGNNSEGDVKSSPPTTPSTTVPAAKVVTGISPKSAMDNIPLNLLGGIPMAVDEGHIWMTDYVSLGTYSKADESWTVAKLPWDRESLDGMTLAASDGNVRGFALVCDKKCSYDDNTWPDVRVAAFTTTGAGRETTVIEVGDRSDLIAGVGGYGVISGSGAPALATVETAGKTFVISNDGTASSVSSVDRKLKAICPIPDGFIGVELVNASEESAVPWGPLPKDWEPDPGDAQRIVIGKDLNSLKPMAVQGEASEVLANWVGQSTACIPNGFALIGTKSAWEYTDGTWQRRNSTMPDTVLNEDASRSMPLPGGGLIMPINSGQLVRSSSGDWSLLPADPIVFGLGDLRLTYTRSAPEPTPDASEEGD